MTAVSPIRVLVVDDSAFARKVLRQVLSNAEGLEVVGVARDGLDAESRNLRVQGERNKILTAVQDFFGLKD